MTGAPGASAARGENAWLDVRAAALILSAGLAGAAIQLVVDVAFFRAGGQPLGPPSKDPIVASAVLRACLVLAAVPIGVAAGRAVGLEPCVLRRWIARHPGAGERALRDAAVGAAVGFAWMGATVVAWWHLAPKPRDGLLWLAGYGTANGALVAVATAFHEETVYRVGVLSAVAWLGARAAPRLGRRTTLGIAIVASSAVFAAARALPFLWVGQDFFEQVPFSELLASMTRTWPQALIGLVLGTLYCRLGLVAAVAAHVAMDAVGTLIVPAVLTARP